MKTHAALPGAAFALALAAMVLTTRASAQQNEKKDQAGAGAQAKTTQGTLPGSSDKPKLSQEELEAKFKATLTKATLSGRWCGIKDGQLTPEKEDKYTILGVSKLGGDTWMIHARIQYAKQDFTMPIPVQVKWAGDTPVLTLDQVGIPGGNSYSARVLIYEKTYAGTWSGGDHAGLLNGLITNEKTGDRE
jgi:hypothetical protein